MLMATEVIEKLKQAESAPTRKELIKLIAEAFGTTPSAMKDARYLIRGRELWPEIYERCFEKKELTLSQAVREARKLLRTARYIERLMKNEGLDPEEVILRQELLARFPQIDPQYEGVATGCLDSPD